MPYFPQLARFRKALGNRTWVPWPVCEYGAMTRSADASPERRRLTPRRLWGLAWWFSSPTVGVVVLVWALQHSPIYLPDTSDVPPAEHALRGDEDLSITTSDGLDLGVWFAPASPKAYDP